MRCKIQAAFNVIKITALHLFLLISIFSVDVACGEPSSNLDVKKSVDIQSQSLEDALLVVSNQFDIDIIFSSKLLEGKFVNSIRGIFTIKEVLNLFFKETQLKYSVRDSGVLVVHSEKSHLPKKEVPKQNNQYVEEMIVNGFRTSYSLSIDKKQSSDIISDHIVAKRLGEFPDANLAEAIQRTPGISVSRTIGGEGQFVTIRGLGPEYNIVRLNGRELPSDENSRNFSFDIFSSGLFDSVEVYKTPSAAISEGAVGGVVNLIPVNPLLNENISKLSLGKIYDANSGSLGEYYSLFGRYSNIEKDIGFAFGVVRSVRHWRSDLGQSLGRGKIDIDIDEDGQFSESERFQYPEIWSFAHKSGERNRLSSFANFSWKLSDSFTSSIDSVFALYDTPEFGIYQNTNFKNGVSNISDFVIEDDALVSFQMTDVPYEFSIDPKNRKVKLYQVGWGNVWNASPAITFKSDVALLSLKRPEGGKQKFWVAGIPGANVSYQARNSLPNVEITLPPLGGNNERRSTDDYRTDEIAVHYMEGKGEDVFDRSRNISLAMEYAFDSNKYFDLGIDYVQRNKKKNAYITEDPCAYCDFLFTFGDVGFSALQPFPVNDYFSGVSGDFPRVWPVLDENRFQYLLQLAEQNPNILDSNGEQLPLGYSERVLAKYSPSRSYEIDEERFSLYGMYSWTSTKLSGNLGIRWVNTDVISSGTEQEILSISSVGETNSEAIYGDNIPVKETSSYENILPSLNLNYALSDIAKVRLNVSKAISRPSLSSLGPDVSWEFARPDPFSIRNGNIDLQPIESNQLDLSLEWYLDDSFAAITMFYKSLENIVTRGEGQVVINEVAYDQSYPVNADENSIFGVELSLSKLFESGFGLQLNTSFTESEDELTTSLTGVSKYSYNAVGFYERDRFEVRLAYSYRDHFISKGVGQNGLPETTDGFGTLDLSAELKFSDEAILFISAQNLSESHHLEYSEKRNRPLNYEKLGYRLTSGVRIVF